MSAACGCEHEPATMSGEEHEATERPWWRDRGIMVPVCSGVAFLAGLILEWSGLEIPALVLFWIGLLLGASTFTPGAVRRLFKGRIGIGLLMTISAIGAVILGYVEEAAALALELGHRDVQPLHRLRNLQQDLAHGVRLGDRKRCITARDIGRIADACQDGA